MFRKSSNVSDIDAILLFFASSSASASSSNNSMWAFIFLYSSYEGVTVSFLPLTVIITASLLSLHCNDFLNQLMVLLIPVPIT